MTEMTNPVLPGSFPDPSICRVGDDFYMVNSSFEYFPGLPIHHSCDLVNWELIGHALDRADQCQGPVFLTDVQSDGGIHAPTIRYNDGVFYLITTNVYMPPEAPADFNPCVNFILTATNPAGPWSEPRVIGGAPGIDPDIFFDDDGRVWYVGTHSPNDPAYPSEGEIWLQELDLDNTTLIGERYFLWRGTGGDWVEGPHMYKYNGRYYLMTAEGGTGFYHAVTIASSETITGSYKSNPRNPILTSRHLSNNYWVNSTGHGDLVELADGRWYMVCLGIRNDIASRSNMGRETHLLPVVWEAENPDNPNMLWPVCAPNSGKVEKYLPLPFPGSGQAGNGDFYDDFSGPVLKKEWSFRRLPDIGRFQILPEQGRLRIWSGQPVRERSQSALVGFRQSHSYFSYQVTVHMSDAVNCGESGIGILQKDNHHLLLGVSKKDNGLVFIVKLNNEVLASATVAESIAALELFIHCTETGYDCGYITNGKKVPVVTRIPIDSMLSRYYTGAFCCLYGVSPASATEIFADFSDVNYRIFA